MTRRKVLLLQPILTHYRIPLMKGLSRSERIEFVLAYGIRFMNGTLKSEEPPSGVHCVHVRNWYFGPGNHFLYQRDVLQMLKNNPPEVVIAGFDVHNLSNVLTFLVARRRGIPFIWWGHGIGPRRSPVSKYIRLRLARSADAVLFYNQEGADLFASWGLPAGKLFVAWNSLDTEEIGRHAASWQQNDRNRILYIGRLIPEKKVDLLIEAFAAAAPAFSSGTILTIVGEGPERPRLEALTRERRVQDRVEFTGALFKEEQIAPYFNHTFVSVSPGYVGLGAIHSLAYGVPMLVARDEPHSPEIAAIQEGVNAVFFESGDIEGLSRQLVRLASCRDELEKMSLQARRTIIERFSVEAMVRSFEAAVEYALSNIT